MGPGHVFYVWFDALLNYYTALSFARDGEDLTERFWPASYHILGKDILKFHAVFWPALLMAADIPLPERELIHGYLLMRDASGAETKMSKSLGNVLDPFEVMDAFGTDALRYYCFREVSFGQDGGVSTTTFGERYESELANDYGNLASRTLAMIGRYRDGVVPDVDVDAALAPDFDGLVERGLRAARPRRDHAGAGAHLAARAPAQPLRRGARAVAARQGRGAAPASSTPRCARSPRASARSPCCCTRTCRRPRRSCSRRSGRRSSRSSRPASARGPAAARSASCRSSSRSRSDRQPHAPRQHARHGRRDRRGRARGRRHAHPHDRHRRRELARGAGRRRGARGRLVRGRPPPQQRDRLHRRAHRRAARARAPPALRRDRRDRPRRLPRLRAAAPTRSARSPPTSGSRASSASRS